MPGGLASFEEAERERVQNARDAQLDRAVDLLKGILLYTQRNGKSAGKVASTK